MVDINRVQNRLLEMGKIIVHILEKNEVPYMITFGTLLGAVRHKGFIPWDDDFDLFLFDDSYDKAMNVLQKELPLDLFLEYEKTEPLYFHGWAHVKDVNSIASCDLYPQDEAYSHKGISVDLYKAVKIGENELEEFLLKEHMSYIIRRHKAGFLSDDYFEKTINNLSKKLNSIIHIKSKKNIYGMALPERYMLIEDVFPLKKIAFDSFMFYGPQNPEKLLTHFYGSYMNLPPIENRHPHYSNVIFIK